MANPLIDHRWTHLLVTPQLRMYFKPEQTAKARLRALRGHSIGKVRATRIQSRIQQVQMPFSSRKGETCSCWEDNAISKIFIF